MYWFECVVSICCYFVVLILSSSCTMTMSISIFMNTKAYQSFYPDLNSWQVSWNLLAHVTLVIPQALFIAFPVAMIPRGAPAWTTAARVSWAEVRMNPVIVECGANERWLLGSPLGALSLDESSISIPALGSPFALTTLMTNTSQLSCNYLTQENQTSAGLYDRWQTCWNCKTAASWPGAPHLEQHIPFIWHVPVFRRISHGHHMWACLT